jgi:hypothetical protein
MADTPSHNDGAGSGQLSGTSLERLRAALEAYPGPDSDDGEVRRALRAIGDDARTEGIKAEQLVASLKQVFDALTPPPPLATQDQRAKRLSHLVTMCVREYYDAVRGVHSSGDAGEAS